MKTIVVTSTSPHRREMFDITYPNMLKYCERHGYYSHVIHLEDGVWAYRKHEVFKELFEQGYELIAYRDDDVLFTNLSVPYESFLDDYYSFYITVDAGGFNGGSVIIKNTEVGRKFNDLVLENRDLFGNEQEFYNSMPMLMMGIDLMKPIQHPSINSYKYDAYSEFPERIGREDLGDWKEGHFILHLPALTIEKRIEIFKNTKVIE